MRNVKNEKIGWFARLRKKRIAEDNRVDPDVGDENVDIDDGPAVPSIRLGNIVDDLVDRKDPPVVARSPLDTPLPDPQEHALRIARALDRLFEQARENDEGGAPDPHIKTLSALFPVVDDDPGRHEVVLRNDASLLTVVPTKISFLPIAGPDGHADIKKSFTAESAYAMALVASKNRAMLEKGVRLSGSHEQQEMLRTAIERVNEELPAGQKLRILPPKVAAQPKQDFAASQADATNLLPPQAVAKPVVKEEAPREIKRTRPSDAPSKMPWLTGAATGALAALFLLNSTDSVKAHNNTPQDVDLIRGGSHVAFEPASQQKNARLTSLATLTSIPAASDRILHDAPPEPVTMASIDRRLNFGTISPSPERALRAPLAGQLTIVRQNSTSSMTLDLAHFNGLRGDNGALAQYRSDFNIVASDVRKGVVKEMDPYLLDTLTTVVGKLREKGYEANQVVINSGYRTHDTNRRVGGAGNSQHLHADAIDFSITGVPVGVLYDTCAEVIGTRGGLGRYKTFVHMDTRSSFARWGRPAPRAS